MIMVERMHDTDMLARSHVPVCKPHYRTIIHCTQPSLTYVRGTDAGGAAAAGGATAKVGRMIARGRGADGAAV